MDARRILLSNIVIGIVVVPVYILLKTQPFYLIFGTGVIVTLSILLAFFYFLGVKFVSTWAILTKLTATLPTSLTLSMVVKMLHGVIETYVILFLIGYLISTPLIFLSYWIAKRIVNKKN